MGNMIKVSSQQLFGLDKVLHREKSDNTKESEKKRFIRTKTVTRVKGLYTFVRWL